MTVPPSPPTEPPSSGFGCGPGLMMTFGLILLLPGLCTIGFMAAFRGEWNDLRAFWPLWIACLAISAVGIYLFYAAEKSRKG